MKNMLYLFFFITFTIITSAQAVLIHYEYEEKEPTVTVAFLLSKDKPDVWEITDELNLKGKNDNHYNKKFVEKTYDDAYEIFKNILYSRPANSNIRFKFEYIHNENQVNELEKFLNTLTNVEHTYDIEDTFNLNVQCLVGISRCLEASVSEQALDKLRIKVSTLQNAFQTSRQKM